ncbi:hypothetical protein TVAG_320190 [Trichomonas vaginalis G3]|uniref:Fcf1 family protein n=1 Tax=Trichomonas vaginalis (strain ATCC PRA-98 / G3) TaxID=412133 RepID=A2DQG7_TRIV3|nr:rRNA-processing protein UTP23 family [Trichomonas vaginalis G3]EAY17424.1 hypothetical protein TVAG_320190 [Trichomonas vaginalis G3]KAI5491436.1 rRNA-processing protein UTP23 family [Trichomonas vaginalis G3]|eukprot:XP_001330793.1 hypothetical protein [Trichomonas vaginalis G3]
MNRVTHMKKLKSAMRFFKTSFGLHPPYLVLCDPNFIFASLDSKINLKDRFTEIFKGQVFLKVTECGLLEVSSLKDKNMQSTVQFCKKQCQLFKCSSHKPMNPRDCILDNLKHGFNGIVCTQDGPLRKTIQRLYPKMPIFYIDDGLQIMPPSKKLKDSVIAELEAKYATNTEKPEDYVEEDEKKEETEEKEPETKEEKKE